jgi:hypothetical protein
MANILPTNYTGTGSSLANGFGSVVNNPIGTITGYLGQQAPIQGYGAGQTPQQQEQQAAATQAQFLANYQNQQNMQAATYGNQTNLANTYQNTINNPNAPSVARAQLGQGVNAANAAATGLAATGTGEQSALLGRQALQQNGAQLGAANAADATVRAGEVANAQQGLGAIYASQLGAQGTQANTAAGAGSQFAGTNASLANTTQNVNSAAALQNAKQNSSFLGTIGNGISSAAALL